MFHAYGKDKGSEESRITLWQRISDKRGELVKALKERPECPPEMLYLWAIYNDLIRTEVSYTEILSYQTLMGEKLNPREVRLLMNIETERRNA